MITSYKFRLYPSKSQINLIEKTFGCCRFVYNHYLAEKKEVYQKTGKSLTRFQQDKDLKNLKIQYPWLTEVDSHSLQCELKFLDESFKNFFKSYTGTKPSGYPKFKKKHEHTQSYTTNQCITVKEKFVRVPKIGVINARISKKVIGRILNATISRRASGKYFISITCQCEDIAPLPYTGKCVGIDVGIKSLMITSDGREYPNLKFAYKLDTKYKRECKKFSKCKFGSKRRHKQLVKLARIYEKISNKRLDLIQKATTEIIKNYDVICLENLNANGMMANHHLARAVADASFYEIKRELEYKAQRYGRTLQLIDRFFPSSQLCHVCGFKNWDIKDLSVREWICPNCGIHHNRDHNAAINILNEGLRQLV